MTIGQQKPGFLIHNEADSLTHIDCKTVEYVVTFFDLGIVKLSFSRSETLVYMFPVASLQTRS